MGKFDKDNFILNTFLTLTSRTYPYGLEDSLVAEMKKIGVFPSDLKKDVHGNYYYQIGDSRTIFASHLDTATKTASKVNHVFDGNIIKTDGSTVLGADDKAGTTVMLYMIKNNIPGLYYFFIGEEVGCIGSGLAAKSITDFQGKYDRIISFDRRDVFSVITHQSWSRCCSNEFADQLATELNESGLNLNYRKDDGGVYTDSAEFIDIIPECTNISVGYYKEHTVTESQDIDHLERLAKACLKVNWENLPTKRNPKVSEYKTYGSSKSSYSTHDSYNGVDYGYSKKRKKKNKKQKNYGFHDDWYDDHYEDYGDELIFDSDGYSPNWVSSALTKNNGKEYFDNGSGLVDITKNKSLYSWIMSKFTGKLTFDELSIIKEQYLDMEHDNDKQFYNYLVEYINDDSL
jgi:hypothetical protein